MTKPRTIVITGASRGIGCELVKQLATDSNNTIIALSRNEEKMQTQFQGLTNVSSFAFDLNKDDVREQAKAIFSSIDSIDILINNAGYLVNKPFLEITHDDMIMSYKVNVTGVMETVQAAIAKMSKAHIVNISSVGGFQGSVKFPGLAAYSTSKAALCSFKELFA
jgi:short-subunit dehydrogenase